MTLIDPSRAGCHPPAGRPGLDGPPAGMTGNRETTVAPPDLCAVRRTIVVVVDGNPQGQGRLSRNKTGQTYYSNSALLKPWRALVQRAALELEGRHMWQGAKKQPCRLCGVHQPDHAVWPAGIPVRFEAECVFPPVASAPGRLYPTVRSSGDWDHLGRAIGDALTGVLWADDSQIVDGRVVKYYSSDRYAPLGDPGAVIWVQRADQ